MKKALTRRIPEAAKNTAIVNTAAITTITTTETNAVAAAAVAVATVTNSPYVSSLSQPKLSSEKKHMYTSKQDLTIQ